MNFEAFSFSPQVTCFQDGGTARGLRLKDLVGRGSLKETLCKLLPTSSSRWATRPCTPPKALRKLSVSRKRTSPACGSSFTYCESWIPIARSWCLWPTPGPSVSVRLSASRRSAKSSIFLGNERLHSTIRPGTAVTAARSEEHTSELQS